MNLSDGAALVAPDPGAARQETAANREGKADEAPGGAPGGCPGGENPVRSVNYEHGSEGAPAHRDDREGAGGAHDGDSGGADPRGVQEDVLQVGEDAGCRRCWRRAKPRHRVGRSKEESAGGAGPEGAR